MFRVIIVEDSKPILRNIKQLIERSGLPLEVVHTAYNGEEALRYIQQHPADILLTDIRMPKLDGLALIELAKTHRPELKVVLISSYSDFEYTRKAINLHVFDYLLKPVEQQQLNEVMQRMIDQLQDEQAARAAVLGEFIDDEELAKLRLGRDFYDQPKLVMLLAHQPFTPHEPWQYETMEPLTAAASDPCPSWLLPLRQAGRYLLLSSVRLKDKFAAGKDWMTDIQDRLRSLGALASAACLYEPIEPARLSTVYHDLEICLRDALNISYPVLTDMTYPYAPVILLTEDESMRPFAEMIRLRQKEQFRLKLTEKLQQLKLMNARWSELESLLMLIDGEFHEAVKELSYGEAAKLEASPPLLEMMEFSDYERFCQQLLDWSDEQFQRLQHLNRKSSEDLFEMMDRYIRHSIYSQLSINDLALQFHVSASYVSRIMKRYTGLTFVQYFTKLKIKEACKMMQASPDLKIREVSDALSFSDQHYFSKVFKEYTGMTPSEYKDQQGAVSGEEKTE